MVTAGVYMIARCGTLFVGNQAAMLTIACIGAFTALFAATIALRQFDLKKVFAYSTISQLGYMFVGVGVLAPVAGVFHLVTHAFFKALLFLASGVVMHAMAGELDMRKMSGLKHMLPKTRWLMLIGCAALAGFPGLAGFFSKDDIIASAWAQHRIVAIVALFAAFLTAYYTFRVYFRVFEGPEILPFSPQHAGGSMDHAHDEHHNHEPWVMILPLIILAIGAIFAGYLNFPTEHLGEFLGKSPSFAQAWRVVEGTQHAGEIAAVPFGQIELKKVPDKELVEQTENLHHYMMIASALIAVLGIYLAYVFHLKSRQRAEALAAEYPQLTSVLEHKYWVDEIYDAIFVRPLHMLGEICYACDRFVIDGLIWAISFIPQAGGWFLKLTTQRGYLQGYAVAMLLGIAVILMVIFL
jgi:NADH-quinone oxidoreductase subunit L